jgi:FkbM family methyltransferase
VGNITASELEYAKSHDGHFFDCHEIRAYLNSSTKSFVLAIDVGANLGAVSYLLASKSKSVISFEPNPETFFELNRNLRLNRISNVVTEQLACSDKSANSTMFMNNYHGHSSLNMRSDLKSKIEVKAIRLDEYLDSKSVRKIDLLKIDVEGHEYSVICGMGRFLNPDLCHAVIWEHSQFADKSNNNSASIYNKLINAGYRIQDLRGNSITLGELLSQNHMDVLAIA